MDEFGPFNTLDEVVRFWTIVLGTWAISATVCLGLASWKGKNVFLWTLLGIVFGPLALLVLWIKTRRPHNSEQTEVQPAVEKKE